MSVNMDMKVLIVDDYPTMLRVLRSLLRQMNFTNIEQAEDGAEAFEKLTQDKFDLVISDWGMEPMSGFELLKKIRAEDQMKDLPFIMITAESTSESMIAAKEAGVSNYIVKPFTAETLRTKLVSVLGDF